MSELQYSEDMTAEQKILYTMETMRLQKAQLVEALRKVIQTLRTTDLTWDERIGITAEIAERAIAKAEGRQ